MKNPNSLKGSPECGAAKAHALGLPLGEIVGTYQDFPIVLANELDYVFAFD